MKKVTAQYHFVSHTKIYISLPLQRIAIAFLCLILTSSFMAIFMSLRSLNTAFNMRVSNYDLDEGRILRREATLQLTLSVRYMIVS